VTVAAAEAVLAFWFGEEPLAPRSALWWRGGEALDAEIGERFGPTVEAALAGDLDAWTERPESALALVLVLDQFTRNAFRGTARAFAGDAQALAVVRNGLDRGLDEALHPLQAAFFYMPLEHAEDLASQDACVQRFEALLERCGEDLQATLRGHLEHAREHRDLIRRFGRFPHRNRVLGRQPTAQEVDYLAAGGKSFGQG